MVRKSGKDKQEISNHRFNTILPLFGKAFERTKDKALEDKSLMISASSFLGSHWLPKQHNSKQSRTFYPREIIMSRHLILPVICRLLKIRS